MSQSVLSVPDASGPDITFQGDLLRVHFDRFDIPSYDLFLKVKRLPEFNIEFHPETDTYTIEAPKRFATLLDVEAPARQVEALPFNPRLFDDQVAIIQLALDAKRFAYWGGCGVGKSLVELEFGRQVIQRTGQRFLLFSLNDIVPQLMDEAKEFYGDSLPIHRIESRAELKSWCKGGGGAMFGITNYEKMNPDADGQVVNEMRHLGGVGLDESNRLAQGGGKQKWALIKSTKGIEFKLSCTATPAPNDTAEFASQASFLERMRNEGEIIWTYFRRDEKTKRWVVKPHARKAFFDFMASWSIYVSDPRRYGWRKGHADIPEPIVTHHEIPMTTQQWAVLQKLTCESGGQQTLFQSRDVNTIERSKLSQIAKGFRYVGKGERTAERIDSLKPGFVADLVANDAGDGLQVLVWTMFNAETDILGEELSKRAIRNEVITGKTKKNDRLAILERFRKGECRVLVSRASMLGFGMNFQQCGSMVFSGWNDSFVQYYQAWRRAVRYGQDKRVRIHLPFIRELEWDMLENVLAKESKHAAAIAEMEESYIRAHRLMGVIS